MPSRPAFGSSSNFDSGVDDAPIRTWNSLDSKTHDASPIRNYSSLDADEPAKFTLGKNQKPSNASLVSEIDSTMKKYTDNLMHAIDGLSARVSQLETKTRNLEDSMDDLKVSLGNNHGITEGKMRQMENILREVQSGVQVIKDKQEIVEAQFLIAKMQLPKTEQTIESRNTSYSDSTVSLTQPPPNAPPPPHQLPNQFPQNPPPVQTPENPNLQYQIPPPHQHHLPTNAPPPPPPHQLPQNPPTGQIPENPNVQYQIPPPHQHHPPANAPPPPPPHQLPHQFPQNPPPGQIPENPNLQYQIPPPHQQHPPPPPPQNQYQSSLSSAPPQQPLHHPEETPYTPPQSYPPTVRPPSPQQFYGATQNVYDSPPSRPGPEYTSPFSPTGHGEQYPYSSGSPMKLHQPSSPTMGLRAGDVYPFLPTARLLPQAPPTGSGGPSSGGSGNRVPIDDVVDKVTNMGFPRDQVRATVRKLTENGQAVDLNIVLDKLMNGGDGRVWF